MKGKACYWTAISLEKKKKKKKKNLQNIFKDNTGY